jgi:hypothetical protein
MLDAMKTFATLDSKIRRSVGAQRTSFGGSLLLNVHALEQPAWEIAHHPLQFCEALPRKLQRLTGLVAINLPGRLRPSIEVHAMPDAPTSSIWQTQRQEEVCRNLTVVSVDLFWIDNSCNLRF